MPMTIESKSRTYLPLSTKNSSFFIIENDLKGFIEEMEQFLDGIHYMNSLDFSKKVMFSQEIKSNNTIEGYYDDISLVTNIIRHPSNVLNEEQKRRILNLYHGYHYIMNHNHIDKESLKQLYSILSNGLLSQDDLNNMGEYYRKNPVYIFYSSRVDIDPDQGVNAEEIEQKMDHFFQYLNKEEHFSCMTEEFIKSQILHFYFCYIHPYYDINGRTSRTTSMWYLLNHQAYPFIIFNRAIQLNKNYYYKVIREAKNYHNITYFLNYMLKNVRTELEKEYAMEIIADNTYEKLSASDFQALYYILSMNGNLTFLDFATFYNRLNDTKNPKDIYQSMLESLLDKKIIAQTKTTNRFYNEQVNFFFEINSDILKNDPKIEHLKLTR